MGNGLCCLIACVYGERAGAPVVGCERGVCSDVCRASAKAEMMGAFAATMKKAFAERQAGKAR